MVAIRRGTLSNFDSLTPNLCMDFPEKASANALTKNQTANLYPAVLSDVCALGPC